MILLGFHSILIINYTVTIHYISLVNEYTLFIADVPLVFLIRAAHHQGDLKKIAALF